MLNKIFVAKSHKNSKLGRKQPSPAEKSRIRTNIKSNLKSTQNTPAPSLPKRQKTRIQAPVKYRLPWGKWCAEWAVLSLLFAGSATIAGGAWISFQIIVNPDMGIWLNQIFPNLYGFSFGTSKSLQTLDQIENNLKKSNLTTGEIISLPLPKVNNDGQEKVNNSILIPVLQQIPRKATLPCASPCRQIVELRLYQSIVSPLQRTDQQPYYHLVQSLRVAGPVESTVLSSILEGEPSGAGATHLPLTNIKQFQGKFPNTGVWFNLAGERLHGKQNIPYGVIVHYATNGYLEQMSEWYSRSGQSPVWQDVTKDKYPELLVEQTVGLEPRFDIYQILPRQFMPNPIDLELISLDETLVNHPDYDNALKLARTGLWSPALDLLQPLQPHGDGASPIKWSPGIQAQFDLIRFHAGLTKAQAIAAWASPNQQVLAKLIDGRWAESLKIFAANLANSADTAKLLQADQGRLWARINTTLRVNPNEQEAIAWGALLIASQQGREEAIAWLDSNTGLTEATRQSINKLLGQLEEAIALASLLETHTSQIMGTVMPLEELKPSQWSRPPASPALKLNKLDQNKTWYVIKVAGFHNGQVWQRQPFSKLLTPTNTYIQWLWRQLGLHKNKEITLTTWGGQGRKSINAQIQALRVENQQLFLLASGENISIKENLPPPLAMTAAAIKFLEPTPLKLGELVKQNPQQANNILPQMWQELQNAGILEYGPVPDTNTIASQLADWVVQTIDLTGNNQPEIMLSIDTNDTNNLATMDRQFSQNTGNPSQILPRSIIFADTGKLIYSEFSTNSEQVLSGLADLQDGGPVALVVDHRQSYQLARWSGDQQKFE